MKFAVYTLTVLSLIGGLTLLSVNSNTVLPYQPLNIAEMQETLGAGPCTKEKPERNCSGQGECATIACTTIFINSLPVMSKKQKAELYDVCGARSLSTDCAKLQTKNQKCATHTFYVGPGCNPEFEMNGSEGKTFDIKVKQGCRLVGGGRSSS